MDIKGVDLNLLFVFEAMMAEKQLSRAAKAMALSQSAMSGALARLRETFKDPLFVRSSQGMLPTHKANQLKEPIAMALAILRDSLAEDQEFNPSECNKTFRIALSDWMCVSFLPDINQRIKKEAPQVNLVVRNMSPREIYEALMAGELDLGISGQADFKRGIYKQVLYYETGKCFVWKGHPAIKNSLSLKDYVRFPHILFSPQGSGQGFVDQALAKKKLRRRIGLRVVYSLAIPSLIVNTDYIATTPAPIAYFAAQHFPIKIFDPPLPVSGGNITQYWNQKNHTDPAHQWLRGIIVDICQKFRNENSGN